MDWDKVKETTDPSVLQKFIKNYPDSPLSIKAQQRLDVLKQAAQEREEKARADLVSSNPLLATFAHQSSPSKDPARGEPMLGADPTLLSRRWVVVSGARTLPIDTFVLERQPLSALDKQRKKGGV